MIKGLQTHAVHISKQKLCSFIKFLEYFIIPVILAFCYMQFNSMLVGPVLPSIAKSIFPLKSSHLAVPRFEDDLYHCLLVELEET